MDLMSRSYSEIVQSASRFKIEPVTETEEALLHQEGTILKDGDMASSSCIFMHNLAWVCYKLYV